MSDLVAGLNTRSSSITRQRSPRSAITVVFFAHGFLTGSWAPHIPYVKAALGLSDGMLGVALLAGPVGSVAAMAVTGRCIPRLGSRRMVQITFAGYCTVGTFLGLTGSFIGLFVGLFCWGVFQGSLDVAMNTQAITVERAARRQLMAGLHGAWSVGSFTGAAIGTLAVGAGIHLAPQLLILGVMCLAVGGTLSTRLLADATERPQRQPRARKRGWSGTLVLLGTIAFACMLCEGATANWAAVYMSGPLGSGGAVPGLAYTGFSLTMAVTRLSGNQLLMRWPARRLLPVLTAIATIGISVGLSIGQPAAAIGGFTMLGVGLGVVVPTVFSAAGRQSLHPGTAVATVAACGWAGFVCGPPLIGRLASTWSLSAALTVIPILTAYLVFTTRRVNR